MSLPTADDLNALPKRKALNLLFRSVDDALWAGDEQQEWPEIDSWLRELDPEALSTTLMVGVLSITLPIARLPWRREWFNRAEKVLRIREGDRTDRLLAGLEGQSS